MTYTDGLPTAPISEARKYLINEVVNRAAKQSSPTQKQAAGKAAELVLDEITKGVIEESIISRAEAVAKQLQETVEDANDALLPTTEMQYMTDRGREVINIATALVRTLVREATSTGTVSRKQRRSAWGDDYSTSVDPTVARDAIRATSYIVWAYVTAGAPFPKEDKQ